MDSDGARDAGPGADAEEVTEEVTTQRDGRVGIVTIDRPQARNALSSGVMRAVLAAVREWDASPEVGAIVIQGAGAHFAAGADIREMAGYDFAEAFAGDLFAAWEGLARVRTPLVAAVRGAALGGGCELAMLCDVVVAGEGAVFGQPEVKLGLIPGMGGTQRLTRAIGPAKAMDMILTGRTIDAAEAERIGLVSRVVPDEAVLTEALAVAATISEYSLPVVMLAKEAVAHAADSTLTAGTAHERRLFHAAFATQDHAEGISAFLERRPPRFAHR